MPQFDAALANIIHLLDLPGHPIVGQFGAEDAVLPSLLTPVVGHVIDVGHATTSSPVPPLNLLVQWGGFDERASQLVRPGGWVVVMRDYPGRWAKPHPFPAARVAAMRRWLVSPGLHFSYAVVPLNRVAMRAHQFATRGPGWKRAARLIGIRFGWPAQEFTGEVVAVKLS